MATQTATMNERNKIVDWFENDFKNAAMQSTKTSRLDDGRVNYSFSVVNDSGMDFSRFSFKVKILNKANKKEIGSATIEAGAWAAGEKKTFKSNIAIPEDVKGISFVMFSESLSYDGAKADENVTIKDVVDDIMNTEGGVLGELFKDGGMPQSTTVTKTTKTTTSGGKTTTTTTKTTTSGNTTKTTTTTRNTGSTGGSYAQRKSEKKLNKMRLGKSGWTVTALVFGICGALAAMASTNTPTETVEYIAFGGFFLILALLFKLFYNARGKKIRTYEANVKKNGNTSLYDLAVKVGKPVEKVEDELQQMIVDGFFPEAYVDVNNALLVMTKNGEPIESVEESAAASKKARRMAAKQKGKDADSIDDLLIMTDDKEIRTKLKNLKAIQDKIDARIEEVPKLADQVKDYEEKYYPEVVRLTDEYNAKIASLQSGEADAEKPEGDFDVNPASLADQAKDIKSQLIKMIDLVIEASENLLERLHEDDINDISTDIKSLQTTLAAKGLLDSDFDVKL